MPAASLPAFLDAVLAQPAAQRFAGTGQHVELFAISKLMLVS